MATAWPVNLQHSKQEVDRSLVPLHVRPPGKPFRLRFRSRSPSLLTALSYRLWRYPGMGQMSRLDRDICQPCHRDGRWIVQVGGDDLSPTDWPLLPLLVLEKEVAR